jgi:adenylate kinase family enzyme
MRQYEESTAPLIQYYNRAGLILHVDCSRGSREAFESTLALLKARAQSGTPI